MAHGTWKFAAQASMDDLRHGEGAQANYHWSWYWWSKKVPLSEELTFVNMCLSLLI